MQLEKKKLSLIKYNHLMTVGRWNHKKEIFIYSSLKNSFQIATDEVESYIFKTMRTKSIKVGHGQLFRAI